MNRHISGLVAVMLAFTATYAIDGHAVSVSWRNGCFWAGNLYNEAPEIQEVTGVMRGALCKYTIVNNRRARIDTLHHRSQGMAQYPALSLDGRHVAFYRWGSRVQGTQLLGTGDPCHIAVVNIDGTGLENLAQLDNEPASECAVDWPSGDWIYYVNPTSGGNIWDRESPHIWRVNRVTKTNEYVCTSGGGSAPSSAWLRRFTLSVDATRAGLQGINYGFNMNGAFVFGSPDCNGSGLGYAGSCNASISPSGCYVGGYMGGWHQEVHLARLSGCSGMEPTSADFPTLQDAAAWTGEEIGVGAEVIRWSVNSDKWLTQCIGWFAHAMTLFDGSNSVAENWIDRQAIAVTNSPKLNQSSISSCNAVAYGNCAGDLWIAGGPESSYEDVNGTWHYVAPIDPATPVSSAVRSGTAMSPIRIRIGGRAIFLDLPETVPATVSISTIKGRSMMSRTAIGDMTVTTDTWPAGSYVIRLRAGTSPLTQAVMIGSN